MFYYLIGLGSNIQPQKHLAEALRSLDNQVDILSQSAVLVNPPCGDSFKYEFHNQLLLVHTPLVKKSLKKRLEQIELELGREAKSPTRKLNDRTIDIDIIQQASCPEALLSIPLEDSYNRQIVAHWHNIKKYTPNVK